jgi:hypothetical protein
MVIVEHDNVLEVLCFGTLRCSSNGGVYENIVISEASVRVSGSSPTY